MPPIFSPCAAIDATYARANVMEHFGWVESNITDVKEHPTAVAEISKVRGERNILIWTSSKFAGHRNEMVVLVAAMCWFLCAGLTINSSCASGAAVFWCGLQTMQEHLDPEAALSLPSTNSFWFTEVSSNTDVAALCCTAAADSWCADFSVAACCCATFYAA